MSRSVTVAFLLVVLVAQRAPRGAGLQDGQPVFRAGVDLVTIDVVATAANGAPVRNLRAEDFEILEDGAPQQIQTFQFVDLSSTSAIRPLPPGIASNEVEPIRADSRRLRPTSAEMPRPLRPAWCAIWRPRPAVARCWATIRTEPWRAWLLRTGRTT